MTEENNSNNSMEEKQNGTDTVEAVKKKDNKGIIIAVIVAMIVLVIVVILTGVIAISNSPNSRAKKQLELGNRYLTEMDFDQAIAAYKVVLEIDPKNVDAYIGLSDAYLGQDDRTETISILSDGVDLTDDEKIKSKLAEVYMEMAEQLLDSGDRDAALILLQESFDKTGDDAAENKISELSAQIEQEKKEQEEREQKDEKNNQDDPGEEENLTEGQSEIVLGQPIEVKGYIFKTEELLTAEIQDEIQKNYSGFSCWVYSIKFEDALVIYDSGEYIQVEMASVDLGDRIEEEIIEAQLNASCVFSGTLENYQDSGPERSDGIYRFEPCEYTFSILDIVISD